MPRGPVLDGLDPRLSVQRVGRVPPRAWSFTIPSLARRRVESLADLAKERGRNRGSEKIEWSQYSVKKCLTDVI